MDRGQLQCSKHEYSLLAYGPKLDTMMQDIDEKEDLLPVRNASASRGKRSRYCSYCLILTALMALNVLCTLLAYSYGRSAARRAFSMDLVGIEEVYKGVDRSLKDHTFRPFDLYNNKSRFTASPGPEVDNAWEEVGAGKNSIFLPLRFGHIFGLDPRRYFHVTPPQWGPNREGYVVQLWATHDVHCVNQLRKSLYYNHEYYKAHGAHLNETEAEHRAHINHCIDIIRERVMCTADAGVIPTAWGEGEFNFATSRKCHDHKSFLDWVNKNKITDEDKADPLVDWNRVPIPSNAILGAAGYHLPTV